MTPEPGQGKDLAGPGGPARDVPGLDLVTLPFTDRFSRLLVFRDSDSDAGLRLLTAEYERDAEDCVLVERLALRPSGPPRAAGPDAVEFGDTGCSLVFANQETVSLGLAPGAWTITLTLPDALLTSWGGRWEPGLPSAAAAAWRVTAASWRQRASSRDGGVFVRIDVDDPAGAQLVLGVVRPAEKMPGDVGGHARLRSVARKGWDDWYRRLPAVPQHLAAAARAAWWTLGVNQLRLGAAPDQRAVVPSKLGYVGHWQWDAYFIAAGLRHGDPGLAREQIQIALDHQRPDGMLPDVVHDQGVLADSGTLPPGDVARGFAPAGGPVPLTKPPLTAWAVAKVHEVSPDPGFLAGCFAKIERCQRWWLTVSDTDGDGLAEYLHPYSSGLDDSPAFDQGFHCATPDLNAYLAVQYDELARIAGWLGRAADRERLAGQARAHASLLVLRQWDGRRFVTLPGGAGPHTVTDLLPLFCGRLPAPVVDALVADLADPAAFGTWPAVPTVSRADASYQPDRMWRGPVWLNTNYLLIEGLRRHGRVQAARRLTEQTLRLVCAGGPFEYFNAATGEPGSRAAAMFSWTAALFLDLAIAGEGQR